MPIYAYKCQSCGLSKDVLQKMSDDPLVNCPSCGQATFQKQVTAAGFQLKGSGWYATDFKGGGAAAPAVPANSESKTEASTDAKSDTKADTKSDSKPDSGSSTTSTPAKTESSPASPSASSGAHGSTCHGR